MTPAELRDWTSTAHAGAQIVYHDGYLAFDRGGERGKTKAQREVDALAMEAFSLCESGAITLVSRRVDTMVFEYIAIKCAAKAVARRAA